MNDQWPRTLACLLAGLGLMLRADPSLAQQASPAASHFARGAALAKQGDLESAAKEFEAAYQIRPHPTVLYNLGQAYAALGRAPDAVRAFERYLAEAGSIPPARREDVNELIAFHQRRVGKLALSVRPSDAELLVDGKPVAPDAAVSALEVAAGPHTVLARKVGFAPMVAVATVRPRETAELSLELLPLEGSAKAAELEVKCDVPDGAAYLDGKPLGRTPMNRSLVVSPGPHELKFTRSGYETQSQHLDIDVHATASCSLTPKRDLALRDGAILEVVGAPRRSAVLVDGSPYTGRVLPPGTHRVVVESSGYRSFHETVALPRGKRTVLEVQLEPNAARSRQLADETRARRQTYAFVGAGAGLALCGVAGALYAFNSNRYDDYVEDSRRLSGELSGREPQASDFEQTTQLSRRAATLQRMDYLAITTGLVGVALLGGSTVLYLSARSSAERPSSAMVHVEGSLW